MAERTVFLRGLVRGIAAETLGPRSDRQLVERLLGGRDDLAFSPNQPLGVFRSTVWTVSLAPPTNGPTLRAMPNWPHVPPAG
jgi:hypothetical protein